MGMADYIAQARKANGVDGISNLYWTHNHPAQGNILWGDTQPKHYWEAMMGKYNGVCVLRYEEEECKYRVTFRDHQVCIGGLEGDINKAILLALSFIVDRMEQLLLEFKIEDGIEMKEKAIANLTERIAKIQPRKEYSTIPDSIK